MNLPSTLTLNAFTSGDIVSGRVAHGGNLWGGLGDPLKKQAPLAPEAALNYADWTHPDIGWGVVLPDREGMSDEDKALGRDAPQPIQDLLSARGDAPVFRYRSDLRTDKLARYFPEGGRQDPEIGLTTFGVAKGRLPFYLLIVGSPAEIPWSLQFSLNRRHHVGRLDLPPQGLANYVAALSNNWAGLDTNPTLPLVWSVNFDAMTQLMEAAIVTRVTAALFGDAEIADGVNWLKGDEATHAKLIDALSETRPSVILTSSHGKTGPLEDESSMRNALGLPVDADRQTLDVEALLSAWSPGGAVWYAQACCSAGSNDGTSYEGLLEEGSEADLVVRAVGELGPAVAPLPTRLLAAENPLRAFIGHVEPTFDWTLLAGDTGQFLTQPLVDAVYPRLYMKEPVGLAFDNYYRGVGVLYGKLEDARRQINKGLAGARDAATYYRLTASDRESLVILGDPTVVIPPLPSQLT